MFVKSKSGEIDRRIDDCEKIVDGLARLEERSSIGSEEPRLDSKQRQVKLFRLHQEISRLTKDIQKLSRFIGAQYTGFRKLIKKYNKWAGKNDDLASFTAMLESPESFAHTDLTSKFLELSLLYEVLRSNKFTELRGGVDRQFDRSLHNFDSEMVAAVSDRLIFWVHADNVTELKVALLQQLSLYSDSPTVMKRTMSQRDMANGGVASSPPAINNGSGKVPRFPRRDSDRSSSSRSSEEDLPEDQTNVVFFDTPKLEYAQTAKDQCQARWVVANGECSGYVLAAPTGGIRHFATASVSREELETLLAGRAQDIDLSPYDASKKLAIGWVQQRQASPMARAVSNRTRFTNLHNDNNQSSADSAASKHMRPPRVWATLDTNVRFTKDLTSGLTRSPPPEPGLETEYVDFPHAVLEIRWSGTAKPAWVANLEKSHLVHPVSPSFSLYTHSVALFYSIHLQRMPSWMQTIENNVDIRRSAAEERPPPRRQASRPQMSSRANSAERAAASATANAPPILLNAPQVKQQKSFDGYASDHQQQPKPDMAVRYWNEFDDGDEGEDLGVYIEASDHDAGLFSDDNVEKLVRFSSQLFSGFSKIKDALMSPTMLANRMPSIDETASLLSDDDRSSDGFGGGTYSPRLEPRNSTADYHSFAEHGAEPPLLVSQRRNDVLTVLYSICLVLSVVTVTILFGVISTEDVANLSVAAFAFILVALTFSLGIGVLGMSLFLLRDPPVWWHQTLVFASFFSVICFGVGCVAWVLSS